MANKASYIVFQWLDGKKLRPYVCTGNIPMFTSQKEYKIFIPYKDISLGSDRSKEYKKQFIDCLDQFGFTSEVLTVEHDVIEKLEPYDFTFEGGKEEGTLLTFKAQRKIEVTYLVTVLRIIFEHPYSEVLLNFDEPLKPQIYEWYKNHRGRWGTGHSLYAYEFPKSYIDYDLSKLNKKIHNMTSGVSDE